MSRERSFDVVVVGAGTAGSVVARRLAGTTSASVLLIEAGPDMRNRAPVGLHDGWSLNRDYYWPIESEPNETGERARVPRCRIVGGTSWMTRFAVRGSPSDFAEWEALGNPGWSYESVLPFFNAIESDAEFGSEDWHGDAGPIPVTRYPDLMPTEHLQAAVEAIEASGLAPIPDHNRPGALGVGRMPMSSKAGRRVSVADAFLDPVDHPSNMTVRPDTEVTRLSIDHGRVHGVELMDGSRVGASEVVVCAGVFGSPALLMRSGVGPSDHLTEMGLDVVLDLPGVGENLGDHPGMEVEMAPLGSQRSSPILHYIATFHSGRASSDGPPDLMLWVADPVDSTFSIEAVLLKPDSRGKVWLRSPDPEVSPRVRLPGLARESDIERLAEGFQMALQVANDARLGKMASVVTPTPEPPEMLPRVRAESYSVPHFVGTCAMGPDSDPSSVVDALGKVHGIAGLRVIDASIIPIVPSGFTHLSTIMLALKLTDHLSGSVATVAGEDVSAT